MIDIIDLSKITTKEIDEIYDLTCKIIENPQKYSRALEGKILASLFFEPSTRTNFSFTTAMYKLGGQVIGFSDAASSSTSKGESLKDTVKTISKYADIIVMRNPYEGSVMAGSLFSDVPVINAGDGGHLHPTQTLTDLVTIKKYRGSLNKLTIGLCGDLKNGRTVHSLIKSLARYDDVKFVLISPEELKLPQYIIDFLNNEKISYIIRKDLDLSDLDIIYMTRIQKERFEDREQYERLKNVYILDNEKLKEARDNLLIMHPLPRVDEIADEVDLDKRAIYFNQAQFGMYARMALMLTLVSQNENLKRKQVEEIKTDKKCSNLRCITRIEKYLPVLNDEYCGYCDKKMI